MAGQCSGALLAAYAALLFTLRGGVSIETNDIEPESGSIVARVEGAQNISLYCDLRDAQGESLITNWFLQTHQAREQGSIRPTDDKFIQSGDTLVTALGNLSLNTNLTIISLTDDLDDAIIFCRFDERGIDLANFTLRIYRPPALLDGGEVTKKENEELSLNLSDPDSPPAFPFPSEVMWSRQDGVELMNFTNTRVFDYSSIYIGSVVPSDAGIYTLTATNYQLDRATLVGTNSSSFTLNVLFGAGLSGAGSETVAVVEGESVTLVCGTGLTGNPIPTVTWRDSDGSEVMSGGRFTLSSGRDVVSLTLDSSERGDAGNWTCTAQVYEAGPGSLPVGGPVERSVQLVVVVAPSAPEDLRVEVVGATWTSLSWIQSDAGIPPFSGVVILVTEGGVVRNVTVESGSTATNVTGLLPGTDYMFRVVAVSVFGGVQAPSPPSPSVHATTDTSVPVPLCSEAPRVEDDRLVVRWNYTHTGVLPITAADVYFNPDTSPEIRTSFSSVPGAVVGDVTSTEREDSIPLPEAGLHYQFTVRAENSEGATETNCPSIRLDIGVPAMPDPPIVGTSGDTVIAIVTTPHSGVRDGVEDEFHFVLEIHNVDDPDQAPIQQSIAVSCGVGACTGYLSLTTSDSALMEGVTYFMTVMAINRYGQSDVSGKSNLFTITPGNSIIVCVYNMVL